MDRNARSRHHQHCKAVERRARSVDAMAFFNVLANPAMVQVMDTLSPAPSGAAVTAGDYGSYFKDMTLAVGGRLEPLCNR
jgi:hypothetical protein